MKKLFTGILLLIVFLSTSGTNVFAAQNDVQELVNEANQKIQALIVVAKQDAKEVMSNDSLTELEKEVSSQSNEEFKKFVEEMEENQDKLTPGQFGES